MASELNELNYNDTTDLDLSIPEIWAKMLIVEAERRTFWDVYEGGQGSGMPIIRKDDLMKEDGDQIHIQTLKNLTGDGVEDCDVLQGNEEKMVLGQFTITPSLIRNGMAFCQPASMRSNVDAKKEAIGRLAYWLAEKKDNLLFTNATTGATYNKYVNDRLNEGALIAGDELDYATVAKIKTQLVVQNAMPLFGGKYPELMDVEYCLVIHPYDAYYLKADTSTFNWFSAQSLAGQRGDTNPIFSGAMGVLDGMLIKVSSRTPRSGNVSRNIAFGGEAFADGYIKLPYYEEELIDYGNQVGYAVGMDFGYTRAIEENSLVLHAYAAAV